MVFSTITQNGLNLTADTTEIPAQYSNNIPFAFVQDMENYPDYTPTVYATLYDSSLIECADVLNEGGNVAIENGNFTIGNQILYQSGYLAIGITLTNGDENISLQPVIYKVFPSVGGLSPLPPDTGEWQQVVTAYVDTYINPISQQLQEVVTEVANQQTQIDNAISVMGDYQIVSEDPVQIQFKKGNGDFGPTVDLGDGLASKSMVNGKYYQSAAEMYSGAASNYGIQIQQIMGAYVQDGTPTPDNPVDPQFNVINNFYISGENLFNNQNPLSLGVGTGTPTETGVIVTGILYCYYKVNVKPNTDYHISYQQSGNRNEVRVYGKTPFESQNIIAMFKNSNGGTFNSGNTNSVLILFYASDGAQATSEYSNVILNIGTTAQPYTPFVGSSTTPVSIELRALPDGTADVCEDGNITRNVAEVMFDGSSDENLNFDNDQLYASIILNDAITNYDLGDINCLCDKLNAIPTNGVISTSINSIKYGSTSYNNILYIRIDESITSLSELRTWLSQNPITVWYALSTPTTEPLAIPTLTSYYPFTNAWCDSQVPGMITWNVLTGNVKPDELDPAIQEYINNNVPDMITNAINLALASYCPFAIGDIYITSLSANPNTKYPGTTWQSIDGETLVGYLADDPNFGTLGASVGEATHTLTVDEMPSHNHGPIGGPFMNAGGTGRNQIGNGTNASFNNNTGSAGGGQAHNNIQPSRVVMIWQRTA